MGSRPAIEGPSLSRPLILSTAVAFGCATYLAYELGWLSHRLAFAAMTIIVIAYVALESAHLRRVFPERWLLNPPVLCSLLTFVQSYGATNVVFFLTPKNLELVGWVPEVRPSMVKLTAITLVAAIAMWSGYWSALAASLGRASTARQFERKFLPDSARISYLAVALLVIVANASRLIEIKMNVYGFSSDLESLAKAGAVTQYLAYGEGLGKLALLLVSLRFYKNRSDSENSFWFYALVVSETVWGFLSGFKSQVLFPTIIVAASQYLVTGKASFRWLLFLAIGVIAAYAVIEPFRQARGSTDFQGDSLGRIVDTFISAKAIDNEQKAPLIIAVMSRQNLCYIGSFGIEYADSKRPGEGDPPFLSNILLGPVYALIPRFLWPDKPTGALLGSWYAETIFGYPPDMVSIGMGPLTYLYLAGGVVAVALMFLVIGCAQRVLFFILRPASSLPGALVFLGTVPALTIINSSVDGLLIVLTRDIPLLIIVQALVFTKSKRAVARVAGTDAKERVTVPAHVP